MYKLDLRTPRVVLAATVVCFVGACAVSRDAQAPATMTEAQIAAIVSSPQSAGPKRAAHSFTPKTLKAPAIIQ